MVKIVEEVLIGSYVVKAINIGVCLPKNHLPTHDTPNLLSFDFYAMVMVVIPRYLVVN